MNRVSKLYTKKGGQSAVIAEETEAVKEKLIATFFTAIIGMLP